MRRRTFLGGLGISIGTSLAGCISGGSAGPEATATSTPRGNRSPGDSATLYDASIVVDEATVARRVVGPDVHLEPFDGIYLLAQVRSTNGRSEPMTLPSRSSFSVIVGDEQSETVRLRGDLEQPVEGEPYRSVEDAHPDVTTSGWLAFAIPDSFGTVELGCSFSFGFGDDDETAYWTLPVERADAAQLSLDVEGPETVDWGETVEYTVDVENTGSRTGEVQHEAAFSHPEDTSAFQDTEVIEVPAGETVERTFSTTPDDLDPIEFRFQGESFPIEVTPARAELGETVTSPGGVDLWAGNPSLDVFYRIDGREERTFADSDRKYSFVNYRAENDTGEHQSPVTDVLVAANGNEYDYEAKNWFGTLSLVEPVTGPWISSSDDLSAGETNSGWLVHDLDGSVREDDIEVHGKVGDQTVVIWS